MKKITTPTLIFIVALFGILAIISFANNQPLSSDTDVDVVFILQTAGRQPDIYALQKEIAVETAEKIYENYLNAKIHVIEYRENQAILSSDVQNINAFNTLLNAMNYTALNDNETANKGAAFKVLLDDVQFRNSANSFVFHFTQYATTVLPSFPDEYTIFSDININFSQVIPMSTEATDSDDDFFENLYSQLMLTKAISENSGETFVVNNIGATSTMPHPNGAETQLTVGNSSDSLLRHLYGIATGIQPINITFIVDNESNSIVLPCIPGQKLPLPNPTRPGYMLFGWFTKPTGGIQVDADTLVPLVETTYYARWERTFPVDYYREVITELDNFTEYEYSLDNATWTATPIDSSEFSISDIISDTEDVLIYIREITVSYDTFVVKISKRPPAPSPVLSYANENISGLTTAMEYRIDGGAWVSVTDSIMPLNATPSLYGSTFEVRYKATEMVPFSVVFELQLLSARPAEVIEFFRFPGQEFETLSRPSEFYVNVMSLSYQSNPNNSFNMYSRKTPPVASFPNPPEVTLPNWFFNGGKIEGRLYIELPNGTRETVVNKRISLSINYSVPQRVNPVSLSTFTDDNGNFTFDVYENFAYYNTDFVHFYGDCTGNRTGWALMDLASGSNLDNTMFLHSTRLDIRSGNDTNPIYTRSITIPIGHASFAILGQPTVGGSDTWIYYKPSNRTSAAWHRFNTLPDPDKNLILRQH